MKLIKFSIPIWVCLLLMGLAHWELNLLFFPILMGMKQFNKILGEYSESALRKELAFFYGSKEARLLKIGSAFFLTVFNIWALYFVFQHIESIPQFAIFLASIVFVNASYCLPLAHDLEHSQSKISLSAGNLLLFWVCLPFFREDHIQGHHQLVGTKNDHTSARFNQSFYNFFGRAFRQRIYRSYFQKGFLSKAHRQEIQLFTCLLIGFGTLLFWIKPILLFFWLGQATFVYIFHELINYIQHYGLERKQGNEVEIQHSWNSYFKYTNYTLFFLPVHSAHHVGKPLHQITSIMGPRLPLPFFECAVLALMPKIWFLVMNPLVEQVKKEKLIVKKESSLDMNNNEILLII